MHSRGSMRGFTLAEVLITATVAALLAGAALPSFQSHLQRARRADAIAALTKLELAQQRHHGHHGLYSANLWALGLGGGLSTEGLYQLSVDRASNQGYVATASALPGPQQTDTACATLTLQIDGLQVTRGPSLACWNR